MKKIMKKTKTKKPTPKKKIGAKKAKPIAKKVLAKKVLAKKIAKVSKKPASKEVFSKKPAAKRKVVKETVVAKASKVAKATKATKTPREPKLNPNLSTERLGLFGGAFNPIHVGHLNAAMTVKSEMILDRVVFIPVNRAPHREVSGPSAQDRLLLIDAAVSAYQPELQTDDLEIKRGGTSFTVDTLEAFNKTHNADNLFFIIGADSFKNLHTWRDFPKLLKLANFIVTSRPGTELSLFAEDLHPELEKYVASSDGKVIKLKTKRTIELVELDDINVSSTDIRKRLRAGGDARTMVSPQVLDLINEKGFYKRSVPAVKDYKEFSLFCGRAAQDLKGIALKVYDMQAMNTYADFSVICSGTSTRHAISVAHNVVERVKEEYGIGPISFEGAREGHWVLIDYGGVVIHVFEDAMRGQYRIEELWRDCPQIQNELPPQGSKKTLEAKPVAKKDDQKEARKN